MFGFMKSPATAKPKPADPPAASSSNPFDSDSDSEDKTTLKPARRTSSEPVVVTPEFGNESRGAKKQSSSSARPSPGRDRYKNDFRDSGGLQSQTMEDLENYAVYKAEETTKSVNNCLRIAEDIREDATRTLDMLHQQGEQIERTHNMAVDIDKDLSKGEKLLNNLGGMFSKPWKPKKTRDISGPMITSDKSSKKGENNKEQREKLGLDPASKAQAGGKAPSSEQSAALQRVEIEKAKQDDALSDLSNILGDLKGMALDMGSELDMQNKALDHLSADVDELNSRVKGANQRARHLLGK